MCSLVVLSGLTGLAAPPAAASITGTSPLDVRVTETDAVTNASFAITAGAGANFVVEFYNNYGVAQSAQDLAGSTASGEFDFDLFYGWGPSAQPCSDISAFDTSGCEEVPEQINGSNSDQTSFPVSTTDVAPPGVYDLYWSVELVTPIVAWSEPGNILANISADQVVIEANGQPGSLDVTSGQSVTLEACITDNGGCSNVPSYGNFLGDALYICDDTPSGSGVADEIWPGIADEQLGGVVQAYTPPLGESWTFTYWAFVSTNLDLTKDSPCPPSTGLVNDIADPSAALQVTWTAADPSPPAVTLSASTTTPGADATVTLRAGDSFPGANTQLYICARSGTSWLVLPGPGPYVADVPVPADNTAVGSVSSNEGGTAQFVAFLSTTAGLTTCPPDDTPSATYGTAVPSGWQSSWGAYDDYSAIVNVTWPVPANPPQVNLVASSTTASAGQTVAFSASFTNPGNASALYICEQTGGSWLTVSGASPYLVEVPVSDYVANGTASGAGGTATFVAFLSTDLSTLNGTTCPSQDTASSAYGTTSSADYSNVVTVTWGSPSPAASVALTASTLAAGPNSPVSFTATYANRGSAIALYICALIGGANLGSGEPLYQAAVPVPAYPDATGSTYGSGVTVTFVAYLSTEDGQQTSGTCTGGVGANGATVVSSPVTVTWSAPVVVVPPPPEVSLDASTTTPANGSAVTLTATYANAGSAIALYICALSGSFTTSSTYTAPAHPPYVAAAPVPAYPDAAGTVYDTDTTSATSVTFVAYLSTQDGQQTSGSCPSGPPTNGTAMASDFSATVTVDWGAYVSLAPTTSTFYNLTECAPSSTSCEGGPIYSTQANDAIKVDISGVLDMTPGSGWDLSVYLSQDPALANFATEPTSPSATESQGLDTLCGVGDFSSTAAYSGTSECASSSAPAWDSAIEPGAGQYSSNGNLYWTTYSLSWPIVTYLNGSNTSCDWALLAAYETIFSCFVQVASADAATWYVGATVNGGWTNWDTMTWGSPTVTLTSTVNGTTSSTGPSSALVANQFAELSAQANGLAPISSGNWYLYICSPSASAPGLATTWYNPYEAASGAPPPSAVTSGGASGAGLTATFVAFLSSDPNYDGVVDGPATSGFSCPSAPNGIPIGTAGNVEAVSNQVTITWAPEPTGAPPKAPGSDWYPS